MVENYILGKYYLGKGFYHRCAYPACDNPFFFGRKNKLYHGECKKRMDAEKIAIKHDKTKKEYQIMTNNLYILEELYPRSLGKNEIPIIEFTNRRYDFQAPARLIKTLLNGYECHLVHNFAFRYFNNNKTLLIYKKDELYNL